MGLPKAIRCKLHVVHVCDMLSDVDTVVRTGGMIPLSMYETIGVEVARQRAEMCGRARNQLHTLVAVEFDCNEEVVSQILTGVPWQAICRYELRMLMGSTAEKIREICPLPCSCDQTVGKGYCQRFGQLLRKVACRSWRSEAVHTEMHQPAMTSRAAPVRHEICIGS
jgi:hypothetical protein